MSTDYFPRIVATENPIQRGVSLRDHIAIEAMKAMIIHGIRYDRETEKTSKVAYKYADDMIKESESEP